MSTKRTAGDIFDELMGIAGRNAIFMKTPGHLDGPATMTPDAERVVNEAVEFCLVHGQIPNCALEIPSGDRPVRLKTLTFRLFQNLAVVLVRIEVDVTHKN